MHCRLDFVPCETLDYMGGAPCPVGDMKVVEIHVSAGTEILYMDREFKVIFSNLYQVSSLWACSDCK